MMRTVAVDLIDKARAGDGDAFAELTEPYRRELQVHCYRMLGSLQDAEDALQDTLLSAWQGLEGFQGRASLRTWLYRIATNRCLNARRSASRRRAKEWDVPGVEPPEPTRLGEVVWLEPYPGALLEGAIDVPPGPEARYEQSESISLAFVTALQVLPPRQVAVLVLRDVLGFHASEVAGMLDSSVESVNSALKRARASLERRLGRDRRPGPAAAPAASAAEDAMVARFVSAYESADLDALVALLTDDVFISMPPMPFEYEGRDAVSRFFASIFASGRRFDLVRTRANGQPAVGAYLRGPDGTSHGVGLFVLTLAGDGICAMTRFENSVLPWFGLPRSLPSRSLLVAGRCRLRRRPAGAVAAEGGEGQADHAGRGRTEQPAGGEREPRGGHAGHRARPDLPGRGPDAVADQLHSGQAAAQVVGDRLVPQRVAEDAADHVRGAGQHQEGQRRGEVRREGEPGDGQSPGRRRGGDGQAVPADPAHPAAGRGDRGRARRRRGEHEPDRPAGVQVRGDEREQRVRVGQGHRGQVGQVRAEQVGSPARVVQPVQDGTDALAAVVSAVVFAGGGG